MSIITTQDTRTDLQKLVQAHRVMIQGTYDQLLTTLNSISSSLWHSVYYSPQQVLDLYGTDAAELFRLSDILCNTLQQITGQELHVVPDEWTYTINSDGTVTVTAQE